MRNPTLDAAIQLLRSEAKHRGAQSLLAFDAAGNALILIGADELQVCDMLTSAFDAIVERREGGAA